MVSLPAVVDIPLPVQFHQALNQALELQDLRADHCQSLDQQRTLSEG